MGYLWLSISLVAGAVKGYCGKKTSGYVNEYKDAMFINAIRMIFCIIIGFFVAIIPEGIGVLSSDNVTLLLALMSGAMTAGFVVSWLISVKTGAYMMLDVFLMMGTIVPIIASSIMFDETPGIIQWIGFLLLVTAVIIMCSYNIQIKGKMSAGSIILLILCGLFNGLTDLSQKLFVKFSPSASAAVFNFYTYIFAAAFLIIMYFVFPKKNKANDMKSNIKPIIGYILVMSVCLFSNSFFKTMAAAYLPSSQLYPLSQGAALILSSLVAAVFFKEKLTKRCIVGIIISFVALLMINLF